MRNNSINPLNKDQLEIAVNLSRYVYWADLLRKQFEAAFTRDQEELEQLFQTRQINFETKFLESEMYICLWFGVLYTVIEGWPALKLNEPHIEELLRSPFKNVLRNFRNAAIDSDNFDANRVQALVTTGQEHVNWARKVTHEFKLFFESIMSEDSIRV